MKIPERLLKYTALLSEQTGIPLVLIRSIAMAGMCEGLLLASETTAKLVDEAEKTTQKLINTVDDEKGVTQ